MNRKGPGRPWGRRKTDNKSRQQSSNNPSFHRRNFRIVAGPVLFVFSLLRTIAIQLWFVLGILVCRTSILANRSHQRSGYRPQRDAEIGLAMNTRGKKSPGAGDPALASQKHHHRKAFEYISKALKIDEEDSTGISFIFHVYNFHVRHLVKLILSVHTKSNYKSVRKCSW